MCGAGHVYSSLPGGKCFCHGWGATDTDNVKAMVATSSKGVDGVADTNFKFELNACYFITSAETIWHVSVHTKCVMDL